LTEHIGTGQFPPFWNASAILSSKWRTGERSLPVNDFGIFFHVQARDAEFVLIGLLSASTIQSQYSHAGAIGRCLKFDNFGQIQDKYQHGQTC